MSQRNLPTSENLMRDTLRDLEKRLNRLENGGAIRGKISLDDEIIIGNIQFATVAEGPDTVNVVMTNLRTGSTHTISLP